MSHKTIIVGRAAADAIANDKGTASKVRILVNERYTDGEGNKQERTEGYSVVSFGKLGEIFAQYVKKGALVYVEGKNRTRSYEKDGQTRYVTELVASELELLSSKSEGASESTDGAAASAGKGKGKSASKPEPAAAAPELDDDIPF